MSTELSVVFNVSNIACPPLTCTTAGAGISMALKDGLSAKSADESGHLIGEIKSATPFCSTGTNGTWSYVITILDGEIAAGQTVAVEDIESFCCIDCNASMLLDKITTSVETNQIPRESRELYGFSDGKGSAEVIENGDHFFYKFHEAHELHAISVAMDAHLAGYPYAEEPGEVECTVITTPAQATTPWNNLTDSEGDPVRVTVNPASSTPLTNRLVLSVPVTIPAGVAVGLNINCDDPTVHLGLQVHHDFKLIPSE